VPTPDISTNVPLLSFVIPPIFNILY
jgi:hypothetical protein